MSRNAQCCPSSRGSVRRAAHHALAWVPFVIPGRRGSPIIVFVPYGILFLVDPDVPINPNDEEAIEAFDTRVEIVLDAACSRRREGQVRRDQKRRLILESEDF